MADGDLHIVGSLEERGAITNHDLLASFQGERLPVDGIKVIRWNGKLYVFAIEPSAFWEQTTKRTRDQRKDSK